MKLCSVSFQVVVFDGGRGSELQKLSCTGGTIFDVLTFEAYDSSFLVALTEQKLNFFKWQWTVSWKGKIWRNFIKCRCENGLIKRLYWLQYFKTQHFSRWVRIFEYLSFECSKPITLLKSLVASQQIFTCLNTTIERLGKREIGSKLTIKTPDVIKASLLSS